MSEDEKRTEQINFTTTKDAKRKLDAVLTRLQKSSELKISKVQAFELMINRAHAYRNGG